MNPFLYTDRYQLTMFVAYHREGIANRKAVFELYVRNLPASRRYMVACGIGRAVGMIDRMRGADLLRGFMDDPVLGPALFNCPVAYAALADFKFSGRIFAVPEGRVVFPNEPLVRVEGTLAECQMIETLLLSVVNHDTRVASKCSRIFNAAGDRKVWEFGSRRTHEAAAVDAARAAYIAGFAGTSNEAAHLTYGIPVAGTMAHSYILAHAADHDDAESVAFAQYAETFGKATCLVDTFDTIRGVERAAEIENLIGVRIDSGDLYSDSKETRQTLDSRGLRDVQIMVSDDLDEYKIAQLLTPGQEAPIDSFGVGTMAVSTPDAPSLGAVYKLVAIEDKDGRMVAVQKNASGKGSFAGPKQVYRVQLTDSFVDFVDLANDSVTGLLGEPLLTDVRTHDMSLAAARRRHVEDLDNFQALASLAPRSADEQFPVKQTEDLAQLQAEVQAKGRAFIPS